MAFVNVAGELEGAHRIGKFAEIVIEATGEQKWKAMSKLDKEAKKLKNRILQLKKRLENKGFLEHAEESVIDEIKNEYRYDIERVAVLEKRIEEIGKL